MSLNLLLATLIYTPQSSFPWKTSTYNKYLCNFELYRRVNKSLHHVCHGMKGITATCSIYIKFVKLSVVCRRISPGFKVTAIGPVSGTGNDLLLYQRNSRLVTIMATKMSASDDTIVNIS